jgi:hypothetical protein
MQFADCNDVNFVKFLGVTSGKIWIQNVGDIDFKVISATENSNKFQKNRFWKEKSVEDLLTLGARAQATLVNMKRSKNKNDSQVTSYIFMNVSHTMASLISHNFLYVKNCHASPLHST